MPLAARGPSPTLPMSPQTHCRRFPCRSLAASSPPERAAWRRLDARWARLDTWGWSTVAEAGQGYETLCGLATTSMRDVRIVSQGNLYVLIILGSC